MAGCKGAAAHRKAQAKHVAKIGPAAQAARVKRSESRHPGKVKTRKARASKSSGGSHKSGRPRKC